MSGSMMGPGLLPENVHLLTAEEWHGNSRDSVLLRFEHLFQPDEDVHMSPPASFDLDLVFKGLKVAAAEEVMLGANLRKGERPRLSGWRAEESNDIVEETEEETEEEALYFSGPGPKMVTLKPMQIRTFIVDLEQ